MGVCFGNNLTHALFIKKSFLLSQLSTIQTSYSFKFVPPKIDQEGLSASQLSTQKSVPLTVIVQPLPTLWAPNLLLKTICGIGGGGNGGG
jgi:hypothetical protein